MTEQVKKYIKTSITLGVIAASSALLISLSNLATRNRIIENEAAKINNSIKEIYGETASVKEEGDYTKEFKYVNHYYTVVDNNDNPLGLAFRTTGSNSYGKISLIVGFDEPDYNFKGMYVITDEQTYASTLEDKYIDPVNDGEREIDDVSCGATYGAKLVRDMIKEAKDAADSWEK